MDKEQAERNKEQAERITRFNIRILNWKWIGPTRHRQPRVKITDPWFKQSITLVCDDSFRDAKEQAVAWLLARGWNVTGTASANNTIILGNWDSNQQLKGE